ncbi:putative glycosyltransferase EpsJ [Lachnospiraceae bacterium]|nr:putative glycosyltransferase EpsJ [Lachnospiraceae bacterium]
MDFLLKWNAPYVEYIFVNDGSTDESREIILRYAQDDRRIRLIDKENGGCASARNRGIEEAGGRYIGFVDPDDFIDETMYCKLFQRALMGSYEMTYCGYKEYYEEDGSTQDVLNDCLKDPYLTGTYRRDKVQLLAVNTRVAIWRALYRKDILEKKNIRFHESLKRFDDLPFRVEYIFAAGSAACVPEHLYYYRLGRKGQDVSSTDERLFVHFPIFDFLDKYTDEFKDERLQDLLQIVKIQTHGYGLSKIEKKYKKEYLKKAKQQLDRNMGYWRTVGLIMMYTGKGNLGWYTKMKLLN